MKKIIIGVLLISLIFSMNIVGVSGEMKMDESKVQYIKKDIDYKKINIKGKATEDRIMFEDESGKSGYLDYNGNIVIEPKYKEGSEFHGGLAYVRGMDNEDFAIDRDGNKVFSKKSIESQINTDTPGKTVISSISEDRILFKTSYYGNSGYLNKTGKVLIEPKYKYGQDFSDGVALVSEDGYKYKYIDKDGNDVFHVDENMETFEFKEGLAMFYDKNNKLYGFIDKKGNVSIEAQFEKVESFSHGYSVAKARDVKTNTLMSGIIDKTGKWVVLPKFTEITSFKNGIARLYNGISKIYIDETLKPIYKIMGETYYGEDIYDRDIMVNACNGNCNIIDKNGDLILKDRGIKKLGDNIVLVIRKDADDLIKIVNVPEKTNKYDNSINIYEKYDEIIIDNEGNEVSKEEVIRRINEREEKKTVVDNTKEYNYSIITKGYYNEGLVDHEDNMVLKPRYDDIYEIKNGLFIIKKDYKYGFYSVENKKLVKLEYDHMDYLAKDLIKVEKEGKYGLVNEKGKKILDIEYDSVYIEQKKDNCILIGTEKASQHDKFIYDKDSKKLSKIGNYTIESISNGIIKAVDKDGYNYYVNESGQVIYKTKDWISEFMKDYGLGIDSNNGAYIVDKKGKIYFKKAGYYYFYQIGDNLLYWKDKFGVIDIDGNIKSEREYDYVNYPIDDIYIAIKDGKYTCIDGEGKEIVNLGKYDYLKNFKEGFVTGYKLIK